MHAREAAFLALLSSLRQESFISQSLEKWQKSSAPSSQDFALAMEIASGAARMALSLDYIAQQLSASQKLSLKVKERALLRTAVYQFYYMTKLPAYAIVDESIKLSKKYCHPFFTKFLNALLRNLAENKPELPSGHSSKELSIAYSTPLFFVESLLKDYGLDKTLQVLKASNLPPQTMARIRKNIETPLKTIPNLSFEIGIVSETTLLPEIAQSENYYIQNVTPAFLIHQLAFDFPSPKNVLDLCTSPGGKLLAAHDLFPQAELYGNDLTEDKLKRLKQNFQKYQILVTLSCGPGEKFSSNQQFDLIILDVPCSNSGVLNKRPEARWRLTPESLSELENTQLQLINHAKGLLKKGGSIWYMTCSILKRENEELISRVGGIRMAKAITILPNEQGWDGGFACQLNVT